MFCSQCGEENKPEIKFCLNCGTSLTDNKTIVPDEIMHEQEKVRIRNLVRVITNSILAILLVLAVGFTVASFFTPNRVRNAFVITSISLFALFFIGTVVKFIILRVINKK